MSTPVDSDLHKIRAMIIGATAEFSCAFDATSAAAAGTHTSPFTDFGHVKVLDMDNVPETAPRITAVRGVRRQKGTEPTLTKCIYKLTCNEADALKLGFLYSADDPTDFTQSALTGVNGQALDFSATAAVIGKWYDLRTSGGVRVRNLSSVSIATLTENTDFVVDLVLGRVRFLTAQSSSRTPVLTGAAISTTSNAHMKKLVPMGRPVRSGYGRLIVFDKYSANNVVLDHQDFTCDITIESGPGAQDGTSEAAIVLVVTVTSEEGTVFVRN